MQKSNCEKELTWSRYLTDQFWKRRYFIHAENSGWDSCYLTISNGHETEQWRAAKLYYSPIDKQHNFFSWDIHTLHWGEEWAYWVKSSRWVPWYIKCCKFIIEVRNMLAIKRSFNKLFNSSFPWYRLIWLIHWQRRCKISIGYHRDDIRRYRANTCIGQKWIKRKEIYLPKLNLHWLFWYWR